MTTLSERDLRLTLPASVNGRKFDDEQHGLSHCMKAVDWILELPERICFIEVKDLDAPGAKDHGNRDDLLQELLSGRLSGILATKFRDSFLYEWACNRVDQPISYYVIVASADLDDALLMSRTEDLRRKATGRDAGELGACNGARLPRIQHRQVERSLSGIPVVTYSTIAGSTH